MNPPLLLEDDIDVDAGLMLVDDGTEGELVETDIVKGDVRALTDARNDRREADGVEICKASAQR